MKKVFVICCLLAVLFIQNINSQTLGDLYTERDFTMSMPRGWQTADLGHVYPVIVGPAEGGFTPSIVFGNDAYSGEISDYLDAAILMLQEDLPGFRLINRADFTTTSGLRGGSITYQISMNGISMRQKTYVLSNKGGTETMLITCTSPLTNAGNYERIFDECVKTFNWIE
jgi:hypothetical protein